MKKSILKELDALNTNDLESMRSFIEELKDGVDNKSITECPHSIGEILYYTGSSLTTRGCIPTKILKIHQHITPEKITFSYVLEYGIPKVLDGIACPNTITVYDADFGKKIFITKEALKKYLDSLKKCAS
jgi:hypothetical protein